MKALVIGEVSMNNYKILKILINLTLAKFDHDSYINKDIEIVTGGITGGCLLGKEYAEENKFKLKTFPNDITEYNRLVDMIKYSDKIIIFNGTTNKYIQVVINKAKSLNKEYYHYDKHGELIYHFDPNSKD